MKAATEAFETPYIARVSVRGGVLVRTLLNACTRLTAKRICLGDADIDQLRRLQLKWDARIARRDDGVRRTPLEGQAFCGEWIDVADEPPARILLYLHGGAFISDWPALYSAMMGRWCKRLAARSLRVAYRLAPEHPFPAAVEDCLAAYRWLLTSGHRPEDIVIAGDSAGANLALVTLQRLRDAREPLPAACVLLSALVDFTLSSPSLWAHERSDPLFNLGQLIALRRLYAHPERYLSPAVSPLFGDFSGLPPLLFQVGSRELLLDESLRAAAAAAEAGVAVRAEIWEDMGHVFQALPLPQAHAALDHVAAFLARHLNASSSVPSPAP